MIRWIILAKEPACRSGVYPGAGNNTNLSWEQELSKNRDEHLTHIVGVSVSAIILDFEV